MDEADMAQAEQDLNLKRVLDAHRRSGGKRSTGICLECEEPIPQERLDAIPGCNYCVDCQAFMEGTALGPPAVPYTLTRTPTEKVSPGQKATGSATGRSFIKVELPEPPPPPPLPEPPKPKRKSPYTRERPHNVKWTPELDNFLAAHDNTGGPRAVVAAAEAKGLYIGTVSSVRRRAAMLGLRIRGNTKWTPEMKKILRRHYRKDGQRVVQKKFAELGVNMSLPRIGAAATRLDLQAGRRKNVRASATRLIQAQGGVSDALQEARRQIRWWRGIVKELEKK